MKEDYGFKALPEKFKNVQFSREKGREAEDLECMMKTYHSWLANLVTEANLKNRNKIHAVDFANAVSGFFTGNHHGGVWDLRCEYKLGLSGVKLAKNPEEATQAKPDGASGASGEGPVNVINYSGMTDEKRAEIAAKRKAAQERLAAKRARTADGAAKDANE